MGRRKRNSKILEQAHERLNGMKSIDPKLDLGNGLSVEAHEEAVNDLRARLDSYNRKLSELDEEQLALEGSEASLKDFNGRVLAGVGARYGKNSIEYEKVGGVRTDDRKRPKRKGGNGNNTPPSQN
jgi:hypothetical protein